MTDFFSQQPDGSSTDGQFLSDQFAPLRATSPPDWVQSANRSAIETACFVSIPWWRRTVAVPLPLALTTAATLLLMASAILWSSLDSQNASRQPVTPGNKHAAIQAINQSGMGAIKFSPWSVSRTYLESLETIALPNYFSTSRNQKEQDDV